MLPEYVVETVRRFLQDYLKDTGAEGYVIGVSGGLDSAVCLKLAVDAVGSERVKALIMPMDSDEDAHDAVEFCRDLGVVHEIMPIGGILKAFEEILKNSDRRVLGNVMARIRMTLLYGVANTEQRIVLGTSNKSELLVGYFTKWGDGGTDILPIGDLYKTQVRELAMQIGVPERFIKKVPTAGLWPEQTDEGELGTDYPTLDAVLQGIEMRMKDEEIAESTGISMDEVRRIRSMVRRTIHKRRMPLVLKLGARTVGLDWRE